MPDHTAASGEDTARRGARAPGDDRLAWFRAPVRTDVDGVSMGGFANQHAEYLRELEAGRKEPFTTELFRLAVSPGSIVVDGGAYIGYYTLLAARRTGARGRVFSFEPHPRAFHWLQRNLHENRLSDRVHARRECLGDGVGIASFHLADGDGSESSMFVPRSPAGSRAIVCTTLDDALQGDWRVNVMKLDVEGAELHALRGMRGTLAFSAGMKLFVEYNPRALRRADVDPDQLLAELGELGFELQVIDELDRRLAPLEALHSLAGPPVRHVNLLGTLESNA